MWGWMDVFIFMISGIASKLDLSYKLCLVMDWFCKSKMGLT